jgi:hypothetical protein
MREKGDAKHRPCQSWGANMSGTARFTSAAPARLRRSWPIPRRVMRPPPARSCPRHWQRRRVRECLRSKIILLRFCNAGCVLGFAVMSPRLWHVRPLRSRSLRASARADCGGTSFCDAWRFLGGLRLCAAARLLGGLCFCDAARFCFYNGRCF